MIVLYRGARGKGKTLTLVKDALEFYNRGFKIFSNLHLIFATHISAEDILTLSKTSDFFNCIIVIDEIELYFDSRNFKKEESKTFSNFLQQIRKRNITILCTAQYVNLLDLRIRQQLDICVYPNFDKNTGYCTCYYFDLTQIEESFNYMNIKPSIVIFQAKPIFDLYNTYELL